MLDLVLSTVSQGLLWAIMALGVFLTFRVLDIADLSVEGSFPLGAAVAATLIDAGHSVWFAMLIALIAGCIGGTVTALLTTKLKIPALLSGILTMIGLYSVNLMIMGKANVPLLRAETVFTLTENLFGVSSVVATLIVGLVATVIVGAIMYWFFGTVLGTAIRATGCNPQMARAQGINTNVMVILGLLISNGLVALSGALVAQSNGFADVGMGTGTIVIGLASVIIGEVLFGTRSFKNWLISVVLGSVVYRAVIAIVLELGMPPNDLKLFTAVLVAIALSLPLIKNKFAIMKRSEEADA
ncbi:ABC transporter permease [Parasutterella sp.]|uniref:ABC transporter permease n=1 Tax=Parasutterella sp. TaxID=2049037 RepID=UPI003AB8D85C